METVEATDAAPAEAGPAAAGSGWLARIDAWDHGVLRRFASLEMPRYLSAPLIFLVRIGDGWIWAAIAAAIWLALPAAQVKILVAHCLAAIAVSLAIYWPVKLWVKRLRPHENGLGVTAMVPPLDKYSFPSGHTMNNLAVALTLAAYLPAVLAPAIGVPLLLGALRVRFGVHYVSDIVGGGVFGALAFLIARALFPASLF